jgi:hypothetical protein
MRFSTGGGHLPVIIRVPLTWFMAIDVLWNVRGTPHCAMELPPGREFGRPQARIPSLSAGSQSTVVGPWIRVFFRPGFCKQA